MFDVHAITQTSVLIRGFHSELVDRSTDNNNMPHPDMISPVPGCELSGATARILRIHIERCVFNSCSDFIRRGIFPTICQVFIK
jgi:hypothetical protein